MEQDGMTPTAPDPPEGGATALRSLATAEPPL